MRRLALEDWLLDEQRRHVARLLESAAFTPSPASTVANPASSRATRPVSVKATEVWLLAPGACAFSFAAVLIAWGWSAERAELWRVGIPAAFIGQLLLWIGFRLRQRRGAVVLAPAASVRADCPASSAISPLPLPIFPPLPPLAATIGKRVGRV